MFVIGLTGSIGMGKSTTSAMFKKLGVPVQDADAIVHELMAKGGRAVPAIEAAFPGVTADGAVNRAELGKRVFGDPAALKKLESILHPMVSAERTGFLLRAARMRKPVVVVDVPLLFETHGERKCDMTVLVTAPHFVQAARVLARPGVDRDRLDAIRQKQMPDAAKRRLADAVVNTGLGKGPVRRAVRKIVAEAKTRKGRIWPPRTGCYSPGPVRPIILSWLRKI
ncbi:dephospho-CoA kinase [Hwanghaeella sp.]|uniref:dephospho-CoA kinase n=1 Tax=Hwanghaeella sp. TaxID=2605943 RepID=UPI003CCBF56E